MGAHIFTLLTLIAGGVMVADLVTHPTGTGTIFTGFNTLWKTGVNGMLGSTS